MQLPENWVFKKRRIPSGLYWKIGKKKWKLFPYINWNSVKSLKLLPIGIYIFVLCTFYFSKKVTQRMYCLRSHSSFFYGRIIKCSTLRLSYRDCSKWDTWRMPNILTMFSKAWAIIIVALYVCSMGLYAVHVLWFQCSDRWLNTFAVPAHVYQLFCACSACLFIPYRVT
jgi:hypothetical protein